ncbi:ChaB family protein [Funiculus sociatus GB2-A5]|uniref:ChaB family protein n=1 Tax=Funiculus sociatus GB2-A5 TaxID=2933946 RepID=A0ABV0JKU3_9CYAN|nr:MULTISPECIES: ChaB family protein [unclassified Trichocoleus]MBD1906253.1 ChaB family protein [Trichocoleus sp. FACHB-832]MBD2061418.1 ChaB family protein [Trichocoleus sp. FACHB-6]
MTAIDTTTQSTVSIVERTISAVFKEREQIDKVIPRLLERGVSRDDISIIGKNFHSETRITGFITKKDVILGGLKQGGIFGSLFGSALALLTGVGMLFIPFVGQVVAAGPLGAALLGAASGAIAGATGAGLVSALIALGMPEEKAAIYQTRVEAGDFLLAVEVPADKTGEIQLLLESAGGEEVHTSETTLPRKRSGQLENPSDLSPEVRSHLSEDAQRTFIANYNQALTESGDESKAEHHAWDVVSEQFEQDEHGYWSKGKAKL